MGVTSVSAEWPRNRRDAWGSGSRAAAGSDGSGGEAVCGTCCVFLSPGCHRPCPSQRRRPRLGQGLWGGTGLKPHSQRQGPAAGLRLWPATRSLSHLHQDAATPLPAHSPQQTAQHRKVALTTVNLSPRCQQVVCVTLFHPTHGPSRQAPLTCFSRWEAGSRRLSGSL